MHRGVPNDSRDVLLVVLALVVSAIFEVGVNPSEGFWQEDGESYGVKHFAGTPILATTYPALYQLISSFNLAGFSTSSLHDYFTYNRDAYAISASGLHVEVFRLVCDCFSHRGQFSSSEPWPSLHNQLTALIKYENQMEKTILP